MRSPGKTGLRKSGRGASQQAHTEIEVKLRISDRRALLQQLGKLNADLVGPPVHEMNTLFDTQEGRLARHGQMLRLRVEHAVSRAARLPRPRNRSRQKPETFALLTFKGPADGAQARTERYKVREEHEVRIANNGEMPRIFEALGLRPWFRYEKVRCTFRLPEMRSLKVELDETPIGLFVELEGKRSEIDRAAALLGFSSADYIKKSYGALFMEERGLVRRTSHSEPVPSSGLPDMVFGS